jgi:hypothetical protein
LRRGGRAGHLRGRCFLPMRRSCCPTPGGNHTERRVFILDGEAIAAFRTIACQWIARKWIAGTDGFAWIGINDTCATATLEIMRTEITRPEIAALLGLARRLRDAGLSDAGLSDAGLVDLRLVDAGTVGLRAIDFGTI